jgi:feruloyl esterase
MEAQRFPIDFDGIIAGDPGNNRTHLNAGFLWQYIVDHPHGDDTKSILPAAKLAMITNAVVKACQRHNGAEDGGLPTDNFLDDPRSCDFDPAALRCQGGDAETCLTDPEVKALKSMYEGAHDPRTGERIYFGWPYGSEGSSAVAPQLPGWSLYWADPAKPNQPARLSYWRDWAFYPTWNWWDFDWSADMRAADAKLAPVINANSPDLDAFRKSGGKLLQYHGLADPVAPPLESIDYFGRVVADQAIKHPEQPVSDFYRLFLAPGMAHCSGGPGADQFDPQSALEAWVERGVAPNSLVAAHFLGDGAQQHVVFTRPLCLRWEERSDARQQLLLFSRRPCSRHSRAGTEFSEVTRPGHLPLRPPCRRRQSLRGPPLGLDLGWRHLLARGGRTDAADQRECERTERGHCPKSSDAEPPIEVPGLERQRRGGDAERKGAIDGLRGCRQTFWN